MKSVLSIVAIIAMLSVSGLALADCPADLDGTGDVGFSDLTAVLGAWGPCPGCAADLDGTGDVGFSDLTTVLGAWGPCPDPVECRADMPEFYDPSGSALEYMANATCAELHAEAGDGVPACSEAESGGMLTEINWILGNYPFTNAVLDAQAGGGQTYRIGTDALLCITGESGVSFPDGFFDELAACWHGNTSGSIVIDFDWNVNYYEAFDAYEAHVRETYPNGLCELDTLSGAATGFHAVDQGSGWKLWTVRSTETCDNYGCRCDATITVWSNGTEFIVDQVTNNSIFTWYQDQRCEDPRFNF